MSSQALIASYDTRLSDLQDQRKLTHTADLQSKLLQLRKERNALTPFCAAPDEIISCILAELISDPHIPHSFFDVEIVVPCTSWVTVMLVCSRIRAVALRTSELWPLIHLDLANTSWLSLCMTRAGTYPLTALSFGDAMSLPKAQKALHIFPKAAALQFWAHIHPTIALHQKQALAQPLLHLRSLKIVGSLLVWVSTADWLNEKTNGSWDQLVQLHLSKFVLGRAPSFAALQNLTLSLVSCDGDLSILVKFLGSIPLLEVLVLDRMVEQSALHEVVPSSPKQAQTTSWPHLRVLSINHTTPELVNVLLRLLPSPSQTLAICILFSLLQDHFNIPLQHGAPGPSETTLVFNQVREFWQTKSGQENMPPGWVLFSPGLRYPFRIRFGMPPSTVSPTPSIFFEMQCTVGGPDFLLESIDTIEMSLDDDNRDDDDDDNDDQGIYRIQLERDFISIDRNLPNIQHLVVNFMVPCLTTEISEAWLKMRQQEARRIETLVYRHPDGEAWASHMVQIGLVGSATFSKSNERS
jgi:hypothetical protein